MQTFLPYSDIKKSIECLDWRRLGKQRVESMQIHNILTGKTQTKGWRNHPAVLMWSGFENALAVYMNTAITHWIDRGYNNTMKLIEVVDYQLPPWFGDQKFHDSHKSNLLRKDFDFYSQYGWGVSPHLDYIWPIRKEKNGRNGRIRVRVK